MLPEWVIFAVFFIAGMPVQADGNLVDPSKAKTEEECKAIIPRYVDLMREQHGVETVAECRRVPPAPPQKIVPRDKKSEVSS